MKELEWIKELKEDFESGDKERFPTRAHIAYWENMPVDDENREFAKGINKIYRPSAKKGDYAEMRHLGEYYLIGRKYLNLTVNYKKAIYWYYRAAQYKSAYRGEVLYWLAYCYQHTRGADKDVVKAFNMFEALSKIDCSKIELPEQAKFNANANISLAHCYYRGIGTEKNVEKAIAIWEEYAHKGETKDYENGCEVALRCLGTQNLEGKNLPKDYDKAFELFSLASMFGDIAATCDLGWCYENGYGTEKDIKQAVECYREAANCGNIVAKNNLKRLKRKGIITDGDI